MARSPPKRLCEFQSSPCTRSSRSHAFNSVTPLIFFVFRPPWPLILNDALPPCIGQFFDSPRLADVFSFMKSSPRLLRFFLFFLLFHLCLGLRRLEIGEDTPVFSAFRSSCNSAIFVLLIRRGRGAAGFPIFPNFFLAPLWRLFVPLSKFVCSLPSVELLRDLFLPSCDASVVS